MKRLKKALAWYRITLSCFIEKRLGFSSLYYYACVLSCATTLRVFWRLTPERIFHLPPIPFWNWLLCVLMVPAVLLWWKAVLQMIKGTKIC